MNKQSQYRRRNRKGNAIAEFPAVLILLGLIALPLFDLMGLAMAYVSGYVMNNYQTREVALAKKDDALLVVRTSYYNWRSRPMGKVARIDNARGEITYERQAQSDDTVMVTVSTRVQCKPPLNLAFLPHVPGMSAPVDLAFSSTRPMEDPKDAGSLGTVTW